MTEAELSRLEIELNVSLPPVYRQWAMELPPVDEEEESWQAAFNDPENLIAENRSLREDGWYGEPWLPSLLCIGAHDGNHYFIDLAAPNAVYYANHDAGPAYDPEEIESCYVESAEAFFRRK